jgi:hypothetical protein
VPDISVRVSSTWKKITGLFVRASGTWKAVTGVWVRTGGVWKRVYPGVAAPGQEEWSTGGTYSFVVPYGITSIHAALVGGSGNTLSAIRRGASTLLSNSSSISSSVGGGSGGLPPAGTPAQGGGGGAAGYDGVAPTYSGGNGGYYLDGIYYGGGNGGYGGAGGGAAGANTTTRQHGGGVYLHGVGSNGLGGTVSPNVKPGHGSNLGEGVPRGAGRRWDSSSNVAQAGGDLRYTKTAIAVTPGETLTIVVAALASSSGSEVTTGGGVRIIWGEGRSYPSNAKDV